MKSLLWKDFRQNFRLVAAIAAFLLLPYVLCLLIFMAESTLGNGPNRPGISYLAFAAAASGWIAMFLTAFVGGNAIAGERADRSAEFAAYLPIPRGPAIASKFIVALGIIVSTCLGNLVVYLIAVSAEGRQIGELVSDGALFEGSIVVFLFGVSWLFSALLRSPAIASAAGIAGMILLIMVSAIFEHAVSAATISMNGLFIVTCFVLGTAGLVAGTIHCVYRVEP